MTNTEVSPKRLKDLSALTHQGPRRPQRRRVFLFALVCVVLCAACQKFPNPPGSLSLHHCQRSTGSFWPISGYTIGTSVFLPQIMIMPPCHPEPNLKYGPPNHMRITLPEVKTSSLVAIAQCCHKLYFTWGYFYSTVQYVHLCSSSQLTGHKLCSQWDGLFKVAVWCW